MIEYFDMYVGTDDGFVATKDDLIVIGKRQSTDYFTVHFYRNRQKSKRPIGSIGGSTRRWCREEAVSGTKRIIAHDHKIKVQS